MTDYKGLCADLLKAYEILLGELRFDNRLAKHARAALAEPEPQRRCIYSPVQIAECGGPCQQGPEHCDCGELWVTEPEGLADEELILTYALAVAEAVNAMCKPLKPEDYKCAQLAGLRAVLARWGK
jgi:hypothetical protein